MLLLYSTTGAFISAASLQGGEEQTKKKGGDTLNIRKAIAGMITTAAVTALATAAAMAGTINVGTTVVTGFPVTQNETLTSGKHFSLTTNVFFNAGVYTYQYNLTNI